MTTQRTPRAERDDGARAADLRSLASLYSDGALDADAYVAAASRAVRLADGDEVRRRRHLDRRTIPTVALIIALVAGASYLSTRDSAFDAVIGPTWEFSLGDTYVERMAIHPDGTYEHAALQQWDEGERISESWEWMEVDGERSIALYGPMQEEPYNMPPGYVRLRDDGSPEWCWGDSSGCYRMQPAGTFSPATQDEIDAGLEQAKEVLSEDAFGTCTTAVTMWSLRILSYESGNTVGYVSTWDDLYATFDRDGAMVGAVTAAHQYMAQHLESDPVAASEAYIASMCSDTTLQDAIVAEMIGNLQDGA